MNFTDFRGKLLDFLIADAGITALVGATNIHFAEPASLQNPVYPCITVQIRRGSQDSEVYQRFPLIIGAHSEISEFEAMTIMQVVGTRLQMPIFQTASGGVIIFPSGTPTIVFVSTARIYNCFCRYILNRIGL